MIQLFSIYPAGMPGAALLLLRCAQALFIATFASNILAAGTWSALALDLLAVTLAVGFAVRIAAALVAIAGLALVLGGTCPAPMLLLTQILDAAALAMIGPGAFSIDARLFGRSTINLR